MTEIVRQPRNTYEVGQLLTGVDLMDMFVTMTINMHTHRCTDNREFVANLARLIGVDGPYREWQLRLRVVSLRAGSLIMRHGAKPYLDELTDGAPTVTGIVTSFNMDAVSFCIDPGEGTPDKKREVTVMPVDHQTLEHRVTIDILGYGSN